MLTTSNSLEFPAVDLRSPAFVMRSERLGAFHQSRLSFLRAMLRDLQRDRWRFERTLWDIDDRGVGVCVYAARGPQRTYSLVCFSHDLDPSMRTDRVIAEAWDATFALFDGEPAQADIERMAANIPRQEAGRCSDSELVLSRANRSVRLFEHAVDRLASGTQPDPDLVESTGYLMRTTAVYGNGKFGLADRERIADRAEFAGPFRAEMLTVWLIRTFTVDLVEHLARCRAPDQAVRFAGNLRRRFGVGNSTGLGMAPFLIKHPVLLHRWFEAKETALARVRAVKSASKAECDHFIRALRGVRAGLRFWHTDDEIQHARIQTLTADLHRLEQEVQQHFQQKSPWDRIHRWAESNLSVEGQEVLASIVLEPYGRLVDELSESMAADEDRAFRIDGTQSNDEVRRLIERIYDWALSIDFHKAEAQARFWYVSEEKLEPRLGERAEESGGDLEQPLAVGRDMARFHAALADRKGGTLASFLLERPEFRHVARRMSIAAQYPYGEIRENLIGANFRPVDLLRCKLSFFGATRFDPRSDRWLRITLFQGAPYPDELTVERNEEAWVYAGARQWEAA